MGFATSTNAHLLLYNIFCNETHYCYCYCPRRRRQCDDDDEKKLRRVLRVNIFLQVHTEQQARRRMSRAV
jgi:hypothetical protein